MIPLQAGREGTGGAGIRSLDHAGGLILYHIAGGKQSGVGGRNHPSGGRGDTCINNIQGGIINQRVKYQSGGQILWIRGSGVCVCVPTSLARFSLRP